MTSGRDRLEAEIDKALAEFGPSRGRVRNDYYGLLYMERVLGLPRARALEQVAFGNEDRGMDGFAYDPEEGTFRILQFKNSADAAQLRQSMKRLGDAGIPSLFSRDAVPDHQPVVDGAREALRAARDGLRQVIITFVFRGEPDAVTGSSAYEGLREILERWSWQFGDWAGRENIPVEVEVRRFHEVHAPQAIERHPVRLEGTTAARTIDGAVMHVGLVPLADLLAIHNILGIRFLERNIRFGLSGLTHVNRALRKAMEEALVSDSDPGAFAIHHNGVTLSAQRLDAEDGRAVLFVPRLLNGAQTLTSFAHVAERLGTRYRAIPEEHLARLRVLCRIVVGASQEAVTRVTMNTNRQNPVDAWQLRANDLIQLELAERFQGIGVYYQRQENAFTSMPDEAASEYASKPVEMKKLARTYLAVEGQISRLSRLGEVADSEGQYAQIFNPGRLRFPPDQIVLCYKIQFRLRKICESIRDVSEKYGFVRKHRDLVWALLGQGLLNDARLEEHAQRFGRNLSLQTEYTDLLLSMARTPVRLILGELMTAPDIKDSLAKEDYTFMRQSATFDRAMRIAAARYNWTRRTLA